MHTDLTQGSVTRSMLGFAWPLILGNLLQQLYNVADTLIVGRFVGAGALAAVGSSFTLMTFLTSVLLGLCMGSGAVFSILWGARKEEELKASLFVSFLLVGAATLAVAALAFCVVSSAVVAGFAPALMGLFVPPEETEILAVGVEYLRIEGVCYCGIGCLFLLYGLYRAIGRPGLSLVLTVISLGTRVVLAYALAPLPAFGLKAIWWAIPIGWGLADLTGFLWYRFVVLRRGI